MRLALGLASHMGQVGNISGARRALDELPGHINEALATLRHALRGLDPQILSVHKLGEALREQAAALGADPVFRIGAEGTAQGDTALAPEVGAAVYFCCTEALQNTVRHCPGAPVEVTVELDTGRQRLRFSIADQGPGFDAEAAEGGGLQNMADRISAVGGDVRVSSGAGRAPGSPGGSPSRWPRPGPDPNPARGCLHPIHVPGVSTVATGINNAGAIVGFATDAAGSTSSWLKIGTTTIAYQFPGGTDTQAFGINAKNQIAGSYLDGAGVLHGFVLTSPLGPVSHWQSIDDPNGIGSTVVNGINAAGDLVGFYTDAAGNTDGMLATP